MHAYSLRMDVKQIRDEIVKIDSLLLAVEEDLKRFQPAEQPDDSEAVEAEYALLLSSLSSSSPFETLMEETEPQSPPVPDAFTFFGLIQAFMEDGKVLKCLCAIFDQISSVTLTQLEDTLTMVPRLEDLTSRNLLLDCVVRRMCREMAEGRVRGTDALVEACRLLREYGVVGHEAVLALANSVGVDQLTSWAPHVHAEVASYVIFGQKCERCVYLEKVGPALAAQLEESDLVAAPRIISQTMGILAYIGETVPNAVWVAAAERSLRAQQLPVGFSRRSTDLHHLAIALADSNLESRTVWTVLAERLSQSLPLFEVPGTVAAFTKMNCTFESLFGNIAAFRKRVQAITVPSDLVELADHLILAGDKSTGSVITRTLMERRDSYVPVSEDAEDVKHVDLLTRVLLASVVASVDSGTVIPEAILLLRKFQKPISALLEGKQEELALLFHVLLPAATPALHPTLHPAIPSQPHPIHARIEKVLDILGFSSAHPDSLLERNHVLEGGLTVDFAFPEFKTGVVVEPNAVALLSAKRNVLRGMTALKVNVLVQRKGWKIVLVVPEMHPDDKSLTSLLSEPLKKVPINSVLEFRSMEGMTLNIAQRIRQLRITCSSLVEIAKFLFLILKYSIVVQEFAFEVRLTDQFLNLVFADFLSTYLVKNKAGLRLVLTKNVFSAEAVLKMLEAVNAIAGNSGGIGTLELDLGRKGLEPDDLVSEWNKATRVVALRTTDSSMITEDDRNVVLLV